MTNKRRVAGRVNVNITNMPIVNRERFTGFQLNRSR
jgi:hypothetical protein